MSSAMDQLLTCWVREEVLGEFDRHWLELLARLDPRASPAVLLAGALARAAIDQGHLCLELDRLASRALPTPEEAEPFIFPAAQELRAELSLSPLVACPDQGEQPADLNSITPLVLEGNRLYLRRYQQYEAELATAILKRAAAKGPGLGPAQLAASLNILAAAAALTLAPEQQRAITAALVHRLSVISGGPGTGKTTIIFFILALSRLLAADSRQPPPRILLLAPTGKAAARLGEAVREKVRRLQTTISADSPWAGIITDLPQGAMTIHRALGYQAETPTIFRHRADNPLAADLVVVDEASMVDVALMNKLFAAVPAKARLILLGDKDQLASVEAGSILGDICAAADGEGSNELAAGVINLSQGFRFDPQRGIGALTRAINAGDSAEALRILEQDRTGEVAMVDPINLEQDREFQELLLTGFSPCLTATSPDEALARLNDFRLLCPHRRGRNGMESLNLFCRRLLAAKGLLHPTSEWYRGRPIMITANDYGLNLFNGDLGVIWESPEDDHQLRAFFSVGGTIRRFLPSRLPRHETAFAMTVHKSQGSEFEEVAVVLPRESSPLLTRELLYTAISRARRRVRILGPQAVIATAIGRKVERASGLAARL
ncbi:exodeoxyribonuclease V subunit alpha [Desulfurivibrio dismutans]|uniref:exodeoxyribonuclease V subunit alpha n=1 Tax=Desulfurivibrio dismutans TaxID=1398908 RepID=UPI0023DA51B9|nr:exodeoxyribonuclease V subunit alpha [Desulfurivibrio alkaliphilus]MDF1615795.1 exodeoxyribonuclease V subunit alpha [Desulfurivibrio alkaliphilus]